jgi:hypothetical protein
VNTRQGHRPRIVLQERFYGKLEFSIQFEDANGRRPARTGRFWRIGMTTQDVGPRIADGKAPYRSVIPDQLNAERWRCLPDYPTRIYKLMGTADRTGSRRIDKNPNNRSLSRGSISTRVISLTLIWPLDPGKFLLWPHLAAYAEYKCTAS